MSHTDSSFSCLIGASAMLTFRVGFICSMPIADSSFDHLICASFMLTCFSNSSFYIARAPFPLGWNLLVTWDVATVVITLVVITVVVTCIIMTPSAQFPSFPRFLGFPLLTPLKLNVFRTTLIIIFVVVTDLFFAVVYI